MSKQQICGVELPKQITVGCFTIDVEAKKDLCTDEGVYGNYSHHFNRIRIGLECNSQQAFETFFHEVVECINAVYQLDIDHRKIQLLGVGLAQALDSEKIVIE